LVLDRVVDGKYFVFLVGPREVELVVPADACAAGRAAAWCRAALEQDDAAARARIEDKLAQLRQRARPRRVVSGRLLTRLRAGRPGPRRRPRVAGAARAGAIAPASPPPAPPRPLSPLRRWPPTPGGRPRSAPSAKSLPGRPRAAANAGRRAPPLPDRRGALRERRRRCGPPRLAALPSPPPSPPLPPT